MYAEPMSSFMVLTNINNVIKRSNSLVNNQFVVEKPMHVVFTGSKLMDIKCSSS